MSIKSFKTSGVGVDLASKGLVLINKTDFSGAVSHSFGSDANPIFSNAYRNYRIILDNVKSASTLVDFSLRLRANTTDLTTGVYHGQRLTVSSTSVVGLRGTNTSALIGAVDETVASSIIVDLLNPFLTNVKNFDSFNQTSDGIASPEMRFVFGNIDSAVSYNGFTIFSSQNISGTMSVYGYNI
jgi:hypothetical protein